LRSYRIVLIEVDPLMRELAQRWLEEAGHRVVRAAPTELDAAAGADLVMMDVASPRRAAERIGLLQARHAVPILLVSAGLRRSSEPSPALALQLGVAAVLPKPYTRGELLAAVSAALGSSA